MSPPNVDSKKVAWRVGRLVREARRAEHLSRKQLAEEMCALGLTNWTIEVVSDIQGAARYLRIHELIALCYILDRSLDELVQHEPIEPGAARAGREPVYPLTRIGGGVGMKPGTEGLPAHVTDVAWHAAPGQRERLDAVAARHGVTRSALMRQAVEALLHYYESADGTLDEVQQLYMGLPEETINRLRRRLGKWGQAI